MRLGESILRADQRQVAFQTTEKSRRTKQIQIQKIIYEIINEQELFINEKFMKRVRKFEFQERPFHIRRHNSRGNNKNNGNLVNFLLYTVFMAINSHNSHKKFVMVFFTDLANFFCRCSKTFSCRSFL